MSIIDRLIELDTAVARGVAGAVQKKIAVVGDQITDVYAHGRLDACQDGCQKFVEESRVVVPGGAANAARSLENWEANTVNIFDMREPKPSKTRLMVDGRCVFRHDDDTVDFDTDLFRLEAMLILERWNPDAILISDYDKGFMTPGFITAVIALATARGIPCVADAKREPAVYRGAFVKGNWEYGRKNKGFMPDNRWVLTCGADNPLTFRWQDICKLSPVGCVNHVGAGDCFAAHLTLALAHDMNLEDAAAIAHSAGRVYVQFPHNRPPHPQEIRADFLGEPMPNRV